MDINNRIPEEPAAGRPGGHAIQDEDDVPEAGLGGEEGGSREGGIENGVAARAAAAAAASNQDVDMVDSRSLLSSSKDDNDHMKLTGEELEWTLQLKEMMEMEPELDPLADYWYAHLALVEKDKVERAIKRAHMLQAFRQEYDIRETAAHGVQCVAHFLQELPGHCLALSNPAGKCSTMVFDVVALSGYTTTVLQAFYYLLHASCCDLKQVREGCRLLYEFDGFDWTKHIGWKDYLTWWNALGGAYPLREHVVLFRTSSMANVMISMGQKLMPKEQRKFDSLPNPDVSRLDTIYQVPNAQAADQRILAAVKDGLERYYANKAAFSLEDQS